MDSPKTKFNYTDGEIVEESLLSTLKTVADLSIGSDELEARISNWPEQYHYSRVRHNLLRHIPFNKDSSVLEVGCGCGAITRYLSEVSKDVTALDGSETRIKIAKERCRDQHNIQFVCSNIQDFQPSQKYDFITLIGVLEYSNIYLSSFPDPVKDLLRMLSVFLKKDGELIIAIENQLGLKYFAGFPEDHNGVYYYGIKSLYKKEADFRTFGKIELQEILTSCGFASTKFYYPFPDYKLPRVVLTEAGACASNMVQSLWQLPSAFGSKSYHGTRLYSFDEELVWPTLYKNRLLSHMANSFLIRSSQTDICNNVAEPLAYYYSDPARKSNYQLSSIFVFDDASKNLVVNREYLYNAKSRPNHTISSSSYIDGTLLHFLIIESIDRADPVKLVNLIMLWRHFLTENISDSERMVLPASFFDSNPFNLVLLDDRVAGIDYEWSFDGSIDLSSIFIHYYLQVNQRVKEFMEILEPEERKLIISEIVKMFCITEDSLTAYHDLVSMLIKQVYCDGRVPPSLETLETNLKYFADKLDDGNSRHQIQLPKLISRFNNIAARALRKGARFFEA